MTRRTTRALLAGCTLLLGACASLAPKAQSLIVTRHAIDVANCRPLGWYRVRNAAVAPGATHLLLTSLRTQPDSGMAYDCRPWFPIP